MYFISKLKRKANILEFQIQSTCGAYSLMQAVQKYLWIQ